MFAKDEIRFEFEGREIRCPAGVSIAAALAGAGEYGLRTVDSGERRGVFCGIGVCQECNVEVAGHGRVRACMTPASDSMQVHRAARLASPVTPRQDASEQDTATVLTPEVLIIGGGAAGLTAAALLAEHGMDVVLLDERKVAGGQYYKQPVTGDRLHRSLVDDRQILDGRELVERASTSGATLVEEAEVWGAFPPGEFIAVHDGASVTYRPRHTIIATGAFERGLPLPGWTLPGVMTSGAAQTMLKSYGELPGRRLLVAGNGPLNLQIALELQRAGAEVVAVTELAPPPYQKPGSALAMFRHDPGLSLLGIRIITSLKSRRIPLLFGHGLESVEETPEGLRAWVGRFDGRSVSRQRSFDVEAVCMGFGFLPSNEILRNLGCRHEFDPARGQLSVVRSPDCETGVPGVYAIGDCCGLGGAPSAREEGIIAAAAIIRSMSGELPPAMADMVRPARKRLRSHRAFQAALWHVFGAPLLQSELANEETTVCRCESVRLGDVLRAINAGDQSIGSIKRRTRLGMGACQGRYCAPIAADLLAGDSNEAIGEYSFFAPRVPIKPVRICDIAAAGRPGPDRAGRD